MPDRRREPGLRKWSGWYGQKWRGIVLQVYGTTCHLCGKPGANSADHIIPRSKGGNDTLENLRPAHQQCNAARTDMSLGEWFARYPANQRPQLPPSTRWTQ